jgi:hypothetical protein
MNTVRPHTNRRERRYSAKLNDRRDKPNVCSYAARSPAPIAAASHDMAATGGRSNVPR